MNTTTVVTLFLMALGGFGLLLLSALTGGAQ